MIKISRPSSSLQPSKHTLYTCNESLLTRTVSPSKVSSPTPLEAKCTRLSAGVLPPSVIKSRPRFRRTGDDSPKRQTLTLFRQLRRDTNMDWVTRARLQRHRAMRAGHPLQHLTKRRPRFRRTGDDSPKRQTLTLFRQLRRDTNMDWVTRARLQRHRAMRAGHLHQQQGTAKVQRRRQHPGPAQAIRLAGLLQKRQGGLPREIKWRSDGSVAAPPVEGRKTWP